VKLQRAFGTLDLLPVRYVWVASHRDVLPAPEQDEASSRDPLTEIFWAIVRLAVPGRTATA
jgi:hypothetical protein